MSLLIERAKVRDINISKLRALATLCLLPSFLLFFPSFLPLFLPSFLLASRTFVHSLLSRCAVNKTDSKGIVRKKDWYK
jgi:hypothetical protein